MLSLRENGTRIRKKTVLYPVVGTNSSPCQLTQYTAIIAFLGFSFFPRSAIPLFPLSSPCVAGRGFAFVRLARGFEGGAALQRHNTEKSKQIFPEKELRGLSPNFYIHVSMSDFYFPRVGPHIFLLE
jgi:hypothetical protein